VNTANIQPAQTAFANEKVQRMTDNGIATWQHTVTLPVGYQREDGTVLNSATLRKMTGKEEAILTDPKLRNSAGGMITALLASCVVGIEGLNKVTPDVIRQLTSADRNFLLLELRRLTFGDSIETQYRCPHCGNNTPLVEDLSTIEIRPVETSTAFEIPVTLQDGYQSPDNEWYYEMVFRLPNGEDEEAATSRRDPNQSRQRDALLARCLVSVGELEPRRIRAIGVRILAGLSMPDRRLIQKTLDAAAPGPNLVRAIVCDHCGEEFQSTLDMTHFFPLA
jgi:hypothetical protein